MSDSPKSWVQYDKTLPYIEDRDPSKKPNAYLVKDGENSYKVVKGRRPSKMLLVNKLRNEVDSGVMRIIRVLLIQRKNS